ncbi:hypothetical protein FIU86_11435 [Roseovarius sp. THAF9]|uniref:hypothetical protein n=1 Tax=Roseovarius sp. THAF9 TaxID=2587847 RepID=UPI00126802E1|nr:hypothetical protein [Roseovarius sp. THAF9]QFT93454.1 hypothetical protein FIU86_11435 [Roseovarius sp. THAF9]
MTCLSGICRRGACGAAVVIGLLVGAAQAADITDTAFSDASFEEATALVLGAQGAQARPKAAMLWVYRSRLGSLLKTRDLKPGETAELRRICERMHRVARQRRQARFDGYGVEFADGTGDTSELSPSRRVVFFFWDEGRCDSAPSRGKIG